MACYIAEDHQNAFRWERDKREERSLLLSFVRCLLVRAYYTHSPRAGATELTPKKKGCMIRLRDDKYTDTRTTTILERRSNLKKMSYKVRRRDDQYTDASSILAVDGVSIKYYAFEAASAQPYVVEYTA